MPRRLSVAIGAAGAAAYIILVATNSANAQQVCQTSAGYCTVSGQPGSPCQCFDAFANAFVGVIYDLAVGNSLLPPNELVPPEPSSNPYRIPVLPSYPAYGYLPAQPLPAPSSSQVKPSRIFAGPTQYPPTNFAAYGILAFTSRATSDDRSRYKMICRAYVAGLLHFTEVTAPQKSQMVTVWPIETDKEADRINAMRRDRLCPEAVRRYGIRTSLGAIDDARNSKNVTLNTLDGVGPFLLAWSPTAEKGKSDALVLVSDLSKVTTWEQAQEIFLRWSHDIQDNPELWSNGWNIEKFRMTARLWVDKVGSVLTLFGAKE
jgi:hypothetical protein